jgi:acyl-coenzyme A thioesterase PaaI-like protein
MEEQAIFSKVGSTFLPTVHASGPWERGALHGGAPAALIAATFERLADASELTVGRLSFQFLRPIRSEPLSLETELIRRGRRVQEVAARLRLAGEPVCRAKALMVKPVPLDVARCVQARPPTRMDGPEHGEHVRFALDDPTRASFASTAMEMRWLTDPSALGEGRVWMRLRMPILEGEKLTPLMTLAAASDFGNGISSELPFEEFLFINADLEIHLFRPPAGEWIGLHARTILHAGGSAQAESTLHDLDGPVGRAFQTLVVERR